MAVSPIEEKILGRLAKQTASSNALLSASLYQILGLSILLSKKLYRARRLRKLDNTRDTKSLQLYHHIIWLAREGLSITEVYILPYCQNGERGPECRVMAAKLRASLYHVFCLFHNHPPITQLSSPTSSSKRSPPNEARRPAPLRDPIPSMTSETSYITNPYASPPPGGQRTPTRPPGLAPMNISPTQSAAAFLLPPLNFVPMAREHFDFAQHLATSLLAPTHALRLSISLEHAAFLTDCAHEPDRARSLARKAIKAVYGSADGLDDDEFADASALVQALGGIVRRGGSNSSSSPIDRTIAVSPARNKKTQQPLQDPSIPRAMLRTPERLSTVAEEEMTITAPVSRLSSRASASDKASKRRILEMAEERASQRSRRSERSERSERIEPGQRNERVGNGGEGPPSRPHSRQATPPEATAGPPPPPSRPLPSPPRQQRTSNGSENDRRQQQTSSTTRQSPRPKESQLQPQSKKPRDDRHEAILRTLQILSISAKVVVSRAAATNNNNNSSTTTTTATTTRRSKSRSGHEHGRAARSMRIV